MVSAIKLKERQGGHKLKHNKHGEDPKNEPSNKSFSWLRLRPLVMVGFLFVAGSMVNSGMSVASLLAIQKKSMGALALSRRASRVMVSHSYPDEPRNFDYLTESNDTKYINRTIAVVFSGRRSRMEAQLPYLEQLVNDGEIDFVHFHLCWPSPEDRTWLETLPAMLPDWFQLIEANLTWATKVDAHFVATFNKYLEPHFQHSTMIKIDDDVVYLPTGTGAIARAVQYAQANPQAAWTSGLVVNHPLCDHLLQKDGIIPLTHDLDFRDVHNASGILGNQNNAIYQEHRASWRALHDYFLSNRSHFLDLEGTYTIPPGARVALNFMIFQPHQIAAWNLRDQCFDEWTIMLWTKRANRSVHVFKGAPVVHFDYGRQRRTPGMVDDSYLRRYRDLSCELARARQSLLNTRNSSWSTLSSMICGGALTGSRRLL